MGSTTSRAKPRVKPEKKVTVFWILPKPKKSTGKICVYKPMITLEGAHKTIAYANEKYIKIYDENKKNEKNKRNKENKKLKEDDKNKENKELKEEDKNKENKKL